MMTTRELQDSAEPDPTATGPGTRRAVSARQLAANRRNATKSTGPRTSEGKARSSRNAIKHGIYADLRPIERGHFREDPLAIQAMVDDVLEVLQPRNGMERTAAIRVANIQLQIARHHEFEAFEVESATTSHVAPELQIDVHDAVFNADVLHASAKILRNEQSDFSQEDWEVLLYAAIVRDRDVAELQRLIRFDEELNDPDTQDLILRSLGRFRDEPLESLADELEEAAAHFEERIPNRLDEQRVALAGMTHLRRQRRFEITVRNFERLTLGLERALGQYDQIRARTDKANEQMDGNDVESQPVLDIEP